MREHLAHTHQLIQDENIKINLDIEPPHTVGFR